MSDSAEILTAMWKEQREQARHHESQRAAMTNIVILLSSLIVAFVAQRGINSSGTTALTVALVLLGLYGLLASMKYYERYRLCAMQYLSLMSRIDELDAELRLHETRSKDLEAHRQDFPWADSLRMHHVWYGLFGLIMIGGILLTALTLT